jgi:hypothetical protein
MRGPIHAAIPLLLIAAPLAAQEPTRLSDGTSATQVIQPSGRIRRVDVDTVEPVLAAQRDVPAPADIPPPPELDESRDGETVTLDDSVEGPGEKVLPREGGTKTDPDIPPPIQSGEPLPEKVRSSEELAPNVTIRTEGGVTIEEYRRAGQITMIVVNPREGVRYTYMDTDGDGRLEGDPGIEGPVRPVYYTLYEWE